MTENTTYLLMYLLLTAVFAFMIGWVCAEQICRRKNAEKQLVEMSNNLPTACPGSKTQQRQFKELRSIVNDAHKHIVAVSKALKIPAR